jgi:general secretion pathway protein D
MLQTDSAHNILVLSGTREDMDSVSDLVRTFDADWISRMSFALVPLRAGTAESLVSEMQAIITGAAGGAAGAAEAIRLVPIERLNAILVITATPKYLDWARQQIAALDVASEDGAERTYIYHVQYGRASDLADVLGRVFGATVPASSTPSARPGSASPSYLQSSPPGTGSTPTGGLGALGASNALGTTNTSGPTSMLGAATTPTSGLPATSPLTSVLTQTQGAAQPATPAAPASPGTSSGPASSGQPATPEGAAIRVVTDERNNALVIVTTPRQYRRVEEALKRLDVKPMQVAIEATIAEVTLNNELQFGLQWFFRQRNSTGTFTNVPTGTLTQPFPGFSYMLSEANVQLILNALSSITTVKVISSPQLLVLNNQTAQLQVGQEVPVPVQQQQSIVTSEAPLINTINYINTGVILTVTPRANATGEVTLDIVQEVSDVATTTTSGLNAPTINERRIQSTVSVDSGESVALGGLISNSVAKNRSAIPLLGDIPVIGALFRNDDNTTTRTELLVLIEPRIIRGTDDARAATRDLERRMHEIEPIAPAM